MLLLFVAWNIVSTTYAPYRVNALVEIERVIIFVLVFFITTWAVRGVRRAEPLLNLAIGVAGCKEGVEPGYRCL